MIIPRHKICDLCGEEVGINKRYFIICEDCMQEFEEYLHSKLRGGENVQK